MTLRLLLEDYLGLMKEAGELDVFLPLLLSSMGHEVVYRAQGGIRQFGADIVTTGPGIKGKRTLFLWVIKCGDVTRGVWDSGPQSIRQSIEDVADVYLRTHVAPSHRRMPKALVVLTNGDLRPDIAPNIAGFLSRWSRRNKVNAFTVNGSTLAAWTENHLLNEYVLPEPHRSAFRGALATVDTPESSYRFARQLVMGILGDAVKRKGSASARKKGVISSLRAVIAFNGVLAVWGRNAGNLEAPYLVAEFAQLAAWELLCDAPKTSWDDIAVETVKLVAQYLEIAARYHGKLLQYYATESAFATQYPDNVFVVGRVFSELGRLGLVGVIAGWLDHFSAVGAELLQAKEYASRIAALLETHSVSGSPCYDCQAGDVSLAMLTLVIGDKRDVARKWLERLLQRLEFARRLGRLAPIDTDSFEDLVAIRFADGRNVDEFNRMSTLVPVLAMWCVLLDDRQGYEFLVKKVVPLHNGTTFNTWFPTWTMSIN